MNKGITRHVRLHNFHINKLLLPHLLCVGGIMMWTSPETSARTHYMCPNGPMTRSKTKALKEALNALVLNVSTKSELKDLLEYQEESLLHLIHVREGSNTTLFGP